MRTELLDKLKCAHPTQIVLNSMQIKDDELVELIQAMQKSHPNLKELYLSHNQISDNGAVLLAKQMSSFAQLSFIDLQFNQIDNLGTKALFSLRASHPTISFALHANKITNPMEVDDIENDASRRFKF